MHCCENCKDVEVNEETAGMYLQQLSSVCKSTATPIDVCLRCQINSQDEDGLPVLVPERARNQKDAQPAQSVQPMRLVVPSPEHLDVAEATPRDVVVPAAMRAKVQQAADSGHEKMSDSKPCLTKPPQKPAKEHAAPEPAKKAARATEQTRAPSPVQRLLAKPRQKLVKKSVQGKKEPPTQAPPPAQRSDGVPTPAGTEETRAPSPAPSPAPRSEDTVAGMAVNGVAAGAEDATPKDKQQPSGSGRKKSASDSNPLLATPRQKLVKKSVQGKKEPPTQAPPPVQRSGDMVAGVAADGVPTPAGTVSKSGAAGEGGASSVSRATVKQKPSTCESIVDSGQKRVSGAPGGLSAPVQLVLDSRTSPDMHVESDEEDVRMPPTWSIKSPACEWTELLVQNFIVNHPSEAPELIFLGKNLSNPLYAKVDMQHPTTKETVTMHVSLSAMCVVPKYSAKLAEIWPQTQNPTPCQ